MLYICSDADGKQVGLTAHHVFDSSSAPVCQGAVISQENSPSMDAALFFFNPHGDPHLMHNLLPLKVLVESFF